MRAMVLQELGLLRKNPTPLQLVDVARPIPKDKQVLLKISA